MTIIDSIQDGKSQYIGCFGREPRYLRLGKVKYEQLIEWMKNKNIHTYSPKDGAFIVLGMRVEFSPLPGIEISA